jgi:hypothetical protein
MQRRPLNYRVMKKAIVYLLLIFMSSTAFAQFDSTGMQWEDYLQGQRFSFIGTGIAGQSLNFYNLSQEGYLGRVVQFDGQRFSNLPPFNELANENDYVTMANDVGKTVFCYMKRGEKDTLINTSVGFITGGDTVVIALIEEEPAMPYSVGYGRPFFLYGQPAITMYKDTTVFSAIFNEPTDIEIRDILIYNGEKMVRTHLNAESYLEEIFVHNGQIYVALKSRGGNQTHERILQMGRYLDGEWSEVTPYLSIQGDQMVTYKSELYVAGRDRNSQDDMDEPLEVFQKRESNQWLHMALPTMQSIEGMVVHKGHIIACVRSDDGTYAIMSYDGTTWEVIDQMELEYEFIGLFDQRAFFSMTIFKDQIYFRGQRIHSVKGDSLGQHFRASLLNANNVQPIAMDDTLQFMDTTTLPVLVKQNDSDGNGDYLLTRLITTSSDSIHAVVGADDNLTITVDRALAGNQWVDYSICDRGGLCDTARVFINIDFPNLAPKPQMDSVNTTRNTSVVFYPLANDSDFENDSIFISALSSIPRNGTAQLQEDGGITYTPQTAYFGLDSFSYTVCDTADNCILSKAIVTVAFTNVPPVAMLDTTTTQENIAVTIAPLLNDTDNDGDSMSLSTISPPNHGMVSVVASDITQLKYVPDSGFYGTDSFTYTVCDAFDACSEGWVVVTVKEGLSTGIATTLTARAKLYPNPNAGQFTVTLSNITSNAQLRISDVYGRTHLIKQLAKGTVSEEVDINHLANGLYLVEILQANTAIITSRIIKQ